MIEIFVSKTLCTVMNSYLMSKILLDVAKIDEISCETAAAWKWSIRMSQFHWVTPEYSLFLNIIETETRVLV